MIARLCLSDMHLGDLRSTLSNSEVATKVAAYLGEISGGAIGDLILNGDIWEECIPVQPGDLTKGLATSVVKASQHFFGELFKRVTVQKIVVIPGNHDFTLWHWWCQHQLASSSTETAYSGVEVSGVEWPWCVLFGEAPTAKLVFSYPIYWDRSVGDDYPVLIFTHGHLVDPLVLGRGTEIEYILLKGLGCSRPNVPTDADGCRSIRRVAELTQQFILALWSRYSRRDYAYANYIMRRLCHPQTCQWQHTMVAPGWYLLEDRCHKDDAPTVGEGYLSAIPKLIELLLCDPGLPSPVGVIGQGEVGLAFLNPSCLVYGHDHLAAHQMIVMAGVPFLAVGSGGWTSEFDGHRPHTHVLVWEKQKDVTPRSYFIRTT